MDDVKKSGYAEYLKGTMGNRDEALMQRREALTAKLLTAKDEATRVAAAKGASAPVVSGSGYTPYANVNLKATGKLGQKVLPTGAKVTQNWGGNKPQYSAGRHTGVDFGGPVGTKIKSAANGVVIRTGTEGAYGNAIHVRHPDGTTTLYAHLSGINVKVGQKVKSGQTIGKMGSTGNSSGSHLHFEVRAKDSYGADINPYSWLKGR